jgi:hypothetical protein
VDAAAHDQVSAQLVALVKTQPGFMMHVAYPSPGGFSVGEVWESRAQYDTWFNKHVKPNLPAEIQQEVIDSTRSLSHSTQHATAPRSYMRLSSESSTES